MVEWFGSSVVATGRLPLFSFFVAFVAGFLLIRMSVRLIRARVRWWPGNVRPGGLHIHHVVFGVGFMMIGGVAALLIPDRTGVPIAVAAALFGFGSALVLDEFALILHLRDVYWTEQGRASVDAVFVAIALTGLLLTGVRPFGWEQFQPGPGQPVGGQGVQFALMALSLVNLAGSVVSLLKGKIWTGLIGVFLPAVSIIAAVRLAVPGSPWARWRYPTGSAKWHQALRRDRRIRRPLIRAKIRVQELIAGRHDLEPPVDAAAAVDPRTLTRAG
ncbi:hypothetical protein ACFPZ0_10170 [Streptomonospora nanhaiensis]|uniref:Integral membrane protein n=1 Tax=Streptomonospora nanhaiensis TaxID=1323731 RepID=A0A853BQ18_9ACTN|nr:hypothetical protein [Streptomonospora nanhaiensis]MBV2364951.1 hypothetical protein [Streptomonospora nanhaiensis]MBX9390709.1 hypothetical protein [Streptomonospora nanhaiensis]NYI97528.1 hypothetical protein [Streptomonospora nanhaiensis]